MFPGRLITVLFRRAARASTTISIAVTWTPCPMAAGERKHCCVLACSDEQLVRNQDDELNLRIIRSGGKIWQSSEIVSWYRPGNALSPWNISNMASEKYALFGKDSRVLAVYCSRRVCAREHPAATDRVGDSGRWMAFGNRKIVSDRRYLFHCLFNGWERGVFVGAALRVGTCLIYR